MKYENRGISILKEIHQETLREKELLESLLKTYKKLIKAYELGFEVIRKDVEKIDENVVKEIDKLRFSTAILEDSRLPQNRRTKNYE